MDGLFILYLGIFICVMLLFPASIILLIYALLVAFGYPRLAKGFLVGLGLFIVFIIVFTILGDIFRDSLFFKSDAKAFVEEFNIYLQEDDFKILDNHSTSMIDPDWRYSFTLKISDQDKQNIIQKIKKSPNFKKINTESEMEDIEQKTDRYLGSKITQNYELEDYFMSEYFEPNGEGYAPTHKKIYIYKKENTLFFTKIDF